jgi:hypothetical protein
MKKNVLFLIGLVLLLYSLVFNYANYWSTTALNEMWGYRLYFRGILTGALFICVWGAINFKKYMQNAIIALGIGILVLLIMSSVNLIYDIKHPNENLINVHFYYKVTIWAIGISFILITLIRVWLFRLFQRMKYYYSQVRSWLF